MTLLQGALVVSLGISLSGCLGTLALVTTTLNSSAQLYERVKPVEVVLTGDIPCTALKPIYLDGVLEGLTDDDIKRIRISNETIEGYCSETIVP